MRYTGKIAVVVYTALSGLWVYWVLDRQLTFGSELGDWVMIISVAAVHVALGFTVGRGWVRFLPLFTVAIALPLGYPSANRGEPWPLWLGLLLWAPVLMLLVAVGVAVRRRYDRRGPSVPGLC
jgi:hypothetical protein